MDNERAEKCTCTKFNVPISINQANLQGHRYCHLFPRESVAGLNSLRKYLHKDDHIVDC